MNSCRKFSHLHFAALVLIVVGSVAIFVAEAKGLGRAPGKLSLEIVSKCSIRTPD